MGILPIIKAIGRAIIVAAKAIGKAAGIAAKFVKPAVKATMKIGSIAKVAGVKAAGLAAKVGAPLIAQGIIKKAIPLSYAIASDIALSKLEKKVPGVVDDVFIQPIKAAVWYSVL